MIDHSMLATSVILGTSGGAMFSYFEVLGRLAELGEP